MPIRILLADDQDDVRGAFRVILDAQPDMAVVGEAVDGAAAVRQARHLRPDVALVDIRMPRVDGAFGFLLKRSSPALLVEAVRAAVAGDALVSPSITVRLLRRLTAQAPPGRDVGLTERETDIVRALAAGRTNAEIGTELFLAAGTVKNHIATIQRKLGARNRVGIVAWAFDNGMVRDIN
jgi:DNA-binding NarL/FixJ family response regulator